MSFDNWESLRKMGNVGMTFGFQNPNSPSQDYTHPDDHNYFTDLRKNRHVIRHILT